MVDQEILYFILTDFDLFRRFFSSIRVEFFQNKYCGIIFKHIKNYFETIRYYPTVDSIEIAIKMESTNGFDKQTEEVIKILEWMRNSNLNVDASYRKKLIENWIKQSSLRCAIYSSAEILNSKNPDFGKVFSMVKESVSISFDRDYGIDFHDTESKKKIYADRTEKIAFRLDEFNKFTEFGVEYDCLHIIVGGMGTGKSRAMISFGCDFCRAGYDVMYITMEMKASHIMKRVDANMLEVDIKYLPELVESNESAYLIRHSEKLDMGRTGRFIVKHMSSDNTTVNDIRFFYEDFVNKMNITPRIIFIDYVGTMIPNHGSKDNMYGDNKKIVSEMRSFIEEFHLAGFSAVQANSEGIKNVELTLNNIGESRAIGHVADDVWGIWDDPDRMDGSRQKVKVLKTRYSEFKNYKFSIGIIKNQFRLVNYSDEFETKHLDKIPISGSINTPDVQPVETSGDAGNLGIKFSTSRRNQ